MTPHLPGGLQSFYALSWSRLTRTGSVLTCLTLAVIASVLTTSSAAAPGGATVTWISDSDGFWDDGTNWSTGIPPQPGDDVVIDRPGNIVVTIRTPTSLLRNLVSTEFLRVNSTLQVAGDAMVNGGLEFNGDFLAGFGSFHLNSDARWMAGAIVAGTVIVGDDHTLTIDTANLHFIHAATLRNHGTVKWRSGPITTSFGATIDNAASGSWDVQDGGEIIGDLTGNQQFTNAGRIVRSGVVGPFTIGSPIVFANSGVIEFRLGGSTASGQFDSIAAGQVALGGTADVKAINGFVPGPGDFFDVMSFGTRSGRFDDLAGNGYQYTVATYPNGVRLHAAFTNLVRNGTFDDGTTHWSQFGLPDSSYITASVNVGVLEFFRTPAPTGVRGQGTVFQETDSMIPAGAPLTAAFALGNSGTARKRVTVLIVEADFSDLKVCTFWLPAHAPLQTYQMQMSTTKAWTNAAIYFYASTTGSDFYAATTGSDGFYRVDDVSLQYASGLSTQETECTDPNAPTPPGGPPGSNLIVNGDFDSGVVAPWMLSGQIVSQIANGVFEFYRPAGIPTGVILQQSGQAMAPNEIMTATFDLGNSSAVRKRVTAIMHDSDFSDLSACTFWLQPGQPLSSYVMRTYATQAWANATLSVYPATVGADQWIRLDNATFRRTPGTPITGTECVEPMAPSLLPQAERVAGVMALGPVPLAVPVAGVVDLTHAGRARLQFAAGLALSDGWVDVQVRTAGNDWITIGTTALDDVTTWLEIDLEAFLGEIVEVRFVLHGMDEASVVNWQPTFTIDVR